MLRTMSNAEFRRPIFATALARLREPRRRIQVLYGPRQSGKTTVARQLAESYEGPAHYGSADDPALRDAAWLETQWQLTRGLAGSSSAALLVIDEIQKVERWSEVVKRLWDEDTRKRVPLKVLLLGSAALLVQRGLSESLAGRFELLRVPHWSLAEMHEAFGFGVDELIFFGGYPGAVDLIGDQPRWAAYIRDSIVETSLSRDVLLLTRVDKPALMRSLLRLACDYSGQIVSYQKLTGQLQDAGNTTTVAHYLDLLAGAGLVTGLERFSPSMVRRRRSSPKLLALNNALISAGSGLTLDEARADPALWGRLVESAIGAHILSWDGVEVAYWRDGAYEVDFVLSAGRKLLAVEVKSGRRRDSLAGMQRFRSAQPRAQALLVGADGIPIETFLASPPQRWLEG